MRWKLVGKMKILGELGWTKLGFWRVRDREDAEIAGFWLRIIGRKRKSPFQRDGEGWRQRQFV